MKKIWLIGLTFFIALALDVLPLPGWVVWLRPSWTLLVLIYWAMVLPHRVNVGSAFALGLLLDLLQGSLLGMHSVAMVAVIYIVVKIHKRINMLPMPQQLLIVLMLLLLYKVILFALQGLVGHLPSSPLYWGAVLVSVLLWPWVYLLLHDWRTRLQIEY